MLTLPQFEAICADVASGMSMAKACERQGTTYKDGLWPYRVKHPECMFHLNEARRCGAEMLIDMALQVSMDMVTNKLETDGSPCVRDPKVARIGLDGLLRTAGKLNPDAYGDRVNMSVKGVVDLSAALVAADARAAALLDARRPEQPRLIGEGSTVDPGLRALLGD